jgi:hypothetical protein
VLPDYLVFLVVVVFLFEAGVCAATFLTLSTLTLSTPCGRALPYEPLNVLPRRVLLSPLPINSPRKIGVLLTHYYFFVTTSPDLFAELRYSLCLNGANKTRLRIQLIRYG